MTEIVERLERQAVNVENDGHVSAARAMREAATALTEARAEIDMLRDTNDRVARVDNSLAKQLRASIENNAALVNELSTLRARVREVVGPFAEIRQALELISANKPGDELLDERAIFQTWGLKDTPTSKQITLGHLRAARQLMEDLK